MDLEISMLKFYNTLTRKKELFKPLSPRKAGFYACGPTVYDYAHIGNLRTFLFEDVLRRTLQYNNFTVQHVVNFTDVGHLVSDADEGEDKMTKALKREDKPLTLEAMKEVGAFYAQKFKEDIAKLNILEPHIWAVASEHINEQIELIKRLEKKNYVYKTSDGVYFDTAKFPNYGKLAGLVLEPEEAYARIEINPEKKHSRDFALWKLSAGGGSASGGKIGWESPWGRGFPGWHIECSAMSMKYLGESFDIHAGAEDLVQIHHTNEMAQSEAATGKPFVNFWLHGAFLSLGDAKMAKSAGEFIILNNLVEKGYDPLELRYLSFQTHYRKPMKFSWEALGGARAGLEHLRNQIDILGDQLGKVSEEYKDKFIEKINDDLNMPQALGIAQELLKSDLTNEDKLATILDFDRVLGLDLGIKKEEKIPEEVSKLARERETAREEKDWQKADELRDKIEKRGYSVEDNDSGAKIKKI